MSRRLTVALMAAAAWAVPSVALAQGGNDLTAGWMVGALTLVAAIVLLVVALGLHRVARGSAMAENISYVVAACACLGAAVLSGWAARFMPDAFTADQASLGSQLLVIATISFFCVYFYRVRSALKQFLDEAEAKNGLARSQSSDSVFAAAGGPGSGGVG